MRIRNLWVVVLLALPTALGCGSGDPFRYIKVSGTVSYEDGTKLPTGVRLAFISELEPVEGKFHPRPASAFTNEEGEFDSATSRRQGDGIVRGKHKVLVILEAPNSEQVVPAEYMNPKTTPLEVDTDDIPFELRIRKP